MAMLTPYQKLISGRLAAREKEPYLASALFTLIPRETPGLGTYAVTAGAVLLWDPEVTGKEDVPTIAASLAHEVWHMLREHQGRCKALGANPEMFNYAADAEINDDLKAGGWKTGAQWVYPSTFQAQDGLTAEEYYRVIEKMNQTAQAKMTSGAHGAGSGKCGSIGGTAAGKEEGVEDPAKGGETPRSAKELANVRRSVAEAIQSEAAKGRGTLPLGAQRWADSILAPPQVRWQDKLARLARNAVAYRPGAIDYTYTRPSRRQSGLTAAWGNRAPIMPAMQQPIPRVAIIVDTSGSMGSKELTLGLQEVQGILQATSARIEMCACDADVHALRPIKNIKEAAASLIGGGGTDFRPALEAVHKLRPRPDLAIFITDGDGPAPEQAPAGMKVIWLLTGEHCRTPATWGEVITIS